MKSSRPSLAHLGIFVTDIDAMELFYTTVFELVVTDRGRGKVFKNDLVFLSGSADQHHQLVLSTGRAPDTPSTVMQLSFKVGALEDLRVRKALAAEHRASDMIGLNHGNAWSIYFNDPEGNRVEVYVDTPFHTPQPCGEPLDLEMSDSEIFEVTRDLVSKLQGSMPRDDYVRQMSERLI